MIKLLFLLLFIINLHLQLFSQWQAEIRLTNDSNYSELSFNNARCIASNGTFIHVVWYDDRDGNLEIYYKRSTNLGINWESDIRLTNNPLNSQNPAVSVSGSIVHVIWEDERDGNTEIYYKRSTNSGINWGTDVRLTSNSAPSIYPSQSVYDQNVHIVWQDYRDGNSEIYYKRSTDGGVNWEPDIRQTINSNIQESPSISGNSSIVHIAWNDDRDGNIEIYYKRSTDVGINWGVDTRLTNYTYTSYRPSITTSGQLSSGLVHLAWIDGRDTNLEIYYKRSSDGGINWSPDVRLTYDPAISFSPFILGSGLNVHLVWNDDRNGNFEIFYKSSTDGGISWAPDAQLTNIIHYPLHPFVAVSGEIVHTIWEDNRDGNYEIYYKTNPTGNPIGLVNISLETPFSFKLYQNYPNPFNPTTHFGFQIEDFGLVQLVIYDALGKEVTFLLDENLQPGTYEVEWNATNYPSGVYYYQLTAGGFTETKKLVVIK